MTSSLNLFIRVYAPLKKSRSSRLLVKKKHQATNGRNQSLKWIGKPSAMTSITEDARVDPGKEMSTHGGHWLHFSQDLVHAKEEWSSIFS